MSQSSVDIAVHGNGWSGVTRGLRAHRLKIALFALLATALAVLLVELRPKIYTAYTEILVQGKQSGDFGDLGENASFGGDDLSPADMESQLRLITSAGLAAKVIDAVGFTPDQPDRAADSWRGQAAAWLHGLVKSVQAGVRDLKTRWLGPEGPPAEIKGDPARMRLLEAFHQDLTVSRDPLARVISVGFSSNDPAKAAAVANQVADTYLEERVALQRQAVSDTANHLQASLDDMATSLQQAEREIESYRARSDLFAVQGSSGAEQSYAILWQESANAKLELLNTQTRLTEAEAAIGDPERLNSISEVQNSSVISELRRQEAELQRRIADLASSYGRNHPTMVNARAELRELRAAFSAEVNRIVEGMRLAAKTAQSRADAVAQRLAESQTQLATSEGTRLRLRELERNVDVQRRVYESMLDRYQRAREQEKILIDSTRIITPAEIPIAPSNVPGLLLIGLTAFGSVAFGIGCALVAELLRRGYEDAGSVEDALALPVIGLLPKVGHSARRSLAGKSEWRELEAFGYTEGIRGIIQEILPDGAAGGRPCKVVAVTSSVPNEGKTTLTLSLARQAERSGIRTLLVEGDLRLPGLRESLQTVAAKIGLADLLRSSVDELDQAIVKEQRSGVDILFGCGPVGNPFALLRSPRMRQLLDKLRGRYDLILVDCPPVMVAAETKALVGMATEVVFVVRWRRTARSLIQTALRELKRTGASVTGVVLSQIELREQHKYGDAYVLSYLDKYDRYLTPPA